MAKAFIKNPKKLPKVDHIDNNRLNNTMNNLRWFTQSDNILSYHRNFRTYQTILQCDMNGNIIKKWKNTNEILNKHKNYKRNNVNANLRGGSKSAYGYIWMYKTPKDKKIIELKEDEIFRNIGIFEGNDLSDYYVSNHGTVKNKRGMILSLRTNEAGYKIINLTDLNKIRKAYRVHRLVAHAFISNMIKANDKVNHIDKNKANNFYKNLEWLTQQNNVIHAIGKKVKMIDPDTNDILMIFKSITTGSNYLGEKTSSRIVECCKGKRLNAHGFKWEYLKDNETLEMYKRNDDVFVYDLD